MKRLENKNVLVTGGSRGIGRAIVLEMAREGANVLFTYAANEGAARSTATDARGNGARVEAFKADLTRTDDMRAAFDTVAARFGGDAEIYVGSAFSTAAFASTAMLSEAQYDGMFAATRGHYFALQQAAQRLNTGGRIMVLSSGAASQPGFASGAYAGAKAAVECSAIALSKELGPKGVTVNVVSPGVTETDGLVAPKEMVGAMVAQTPLGRLGQPEDVARAVVSLCTPEWAWVTGQVIQVNGGLL
jgi:3-oxoacyl-[acyl-carrier protein] reductase